MSNKKQSSVEWLISKIYMTDLQTFNYMKDNGDFMEAKAMHEEEIDSAYTIGSCDADYDWYEPELYYKKTFNNEQVN